jgi:signal transduction histidine kinase
MVRIKETLEVLIREKSYEFKGRYPIHLQFDSNLTELGLFVDSEKFTRVISNLINNSVEASTPGSLIKIEVKRADDDSLILSIIDHGKGIAKTDLRWLGTYGFTRDKENGSGLGLFSVKEFLSAIGAKLEVDSVLGLGTSVSLHFPARCSTAAL